MMSGMLCLMKNIWRKYIEKFLNVENNWEGEVGPVVSFRKKRLQQLSKD